jgi:AmmeMemoRadiSam system protein B/AmmeMemoRadiSam system protein A
MKSTVVAWLLIPNLMLVASHCTSQDERIDRKPAVAGQFYPATKEELQRTLKDLFSRAIPRGKSRTVLAIISPHAGYEFSGEVAASSFNQIDPTKTYDNIFILGPSHHVGFEGASIYVKGNYVTPLGAAKLNRETADRLIQGSSVFSSRADAHQYEHSVEVQIPFLQYVMKKDFSIVPIVIGAGRPDTYARIADALRPYLNARNLFVISTDFSHYPPYADANRIDKATADAVLSNSPDALMQTINNNADKGVPNLATSMCGEACVLTLLYMTKDNPRISFTEIQYKNSGDSRIGDKERVVGYHAIVASLQEGEKDTGFNLSGKDKDDLLRIARSTVEQYVRNHQTSDIDPSALSPALTTNAGAFVTLQENHELRGCIGRFDASEPLYKVVQEMAIASATQDYRFSPVAPPELSKLEVEISVLTPMRKINSIREIEMGKHGIYIRKGMHAGTFLPQVATETGWSKEEFLGHCAQEKAGIGWDGWKDAEIFVYEAIVFSENNGAKTPERRDR